MIACFFSCSNPSGRGERRCQLRSGEDWFFFDPDNDKATDLKDEIFADDLNWIVD